VITSTEVKALEGEAGRFRVTLINHPRYIDAKKCTACGQCSAVCPVRAVNQFDCGLDLRAATFITYAQAVPQAYAIDRDACIGCGLCEKVCLAGAVHYDDKPRTRHLEVGAIVLAPGNRLFDPAKLETYSYGLSPNVITSLEFERLLSASGPFMGHLMRPYDREEPRRIAWVQCVGSRTNGGGGNSYCSSVCCTYAIKQAMIAKDHARSDLDATIFYMDMRTCGKAFEQYYRRAEKELGVRFIRSRVHSVEPSGEGDLKIRYADETGKFKDEMFDMVVLSVGFEVGKDTIELARRAGVELDEHHFAKTDSFHPVATSRPGIYVCGSFQGPKDIPESVMEASAAAAASSALLKEGRWSQTQALQRPAEINVRGEAPRIGVFVCHCGINIGGVVDVPAVRNYAKSLPHVVYVEDNLYTCSQDTQIKMSQRIQGMGINRVVVAACTPKTHEPLFQETLLNAGLNKYLFEMANIRNQDSWVHSDNPSSATEKAKDLVRMAVAKMALLEPLQETELGMNPEALILGGGVAGMTAARNLADQGFQVHLVERDRELGGAARSLYKTWKGELIHDYLLQLIDEVEHHPLIDVYRATELSKVEGFVGNFTSTLTRKEDGATLSLKHGIVIIATGGKEFEPKEYLYGEDPRVMTQLELDRHFLQDDPALERIDSAVFIQCVGSREPGRPYCSRVCCTHTLEAALEMRHRNPDAGIYVLYRDLRAYGLREDLYAQARKKGILFVRYDVERKPLVHSREDEALEVAVLDPVLERPIRLKADRLILATAILATDNGPIAKLFKLPMDGDGFFVEAHAKLRPVDFATEGVFLCGLAHSPKSIDESIAQALAAAGRAAGYLAAGKVLVSGMIAEVHQACCSRCGVCINICPFGAPTLSENGSTQINPVLCKGCGLCVASCRSGAIELKGCDDAQIMAMINQI
jgi:heterodisulfide reductase subunit A